MHRIIAVLINSTVDKVLWSDSQSGHFTQLCTYAAHKRMFLSPPVIFDTSNVCYFVIHRGLWFLSYDSLSSAMQFAVTTVKHFTSKASFTLPSVAVTAMSK